MMFSETVFQWRRPPVLYNTARPLLKYKAAYRPEKTADIPRYHRSFPREMTFEERAQKFHIDDASLPSSDWLKQIFSQSDEIIQTWVVTRHEYGISALVSETLFRGEIRGGFAKCWLFSQASGVLTRNYGFATGRCYW